VFLSVKVYAEGTADEYINVYKNNADILENNSIISSAIRSLLWYITKAIVFIADASEKLYDTAFGFIDITLNDKVSAFIDAFKPVIVGIMALSLLYLGFVFILSHDKKPNLAINICIFALVVTMGTTLFAELNSGILAFKTGVDSITDKKNEALEDTLKSLFNQNKLFFEFSDEMYIESEGLYQVIYDVSLI